MLWIESDLPDFGVFKADSALSRSFLSFRGDLFDWFLSEFLEVFESLYKLWVFSSWPFTSSLFISVFSFNKSIPL